MTFKPRIAPRNLMDLLVGILVFAVQFFVLFIVTGYTICWITGSKFIGHDIALLVYIVFCMFSVRSVSVLDDGLHFNRVLGSPKFLAWEEITGVTLASRQELIFKGWLWPMLPAREMTSCFSSLGHYRIEWEGGFCYYPPKDAAGFENAIRARIENYRANNASREGAGVMSGFGSRQEPGTSAD